MNKLVVVAGCLTAAFSLTGCSSDHQPKVINGKVDVEYMDLNERLSSVKDPGYQFVKDPDTKCEYIIVRNNSGIGVTPRIGEDGKPICR